MVLHPLVQKYSKALYSKNKDQIREASQILVKSHMDFENLINAHAYSVVYKDYYSMSAFQEKLLKIANDDISRYLVLYYPSTHKKTGKFQKEVKKRINRHLPEFSLEQLLQLHKSAVKGNVFERRFARQIQETIFDNYSGEHLYNALLSMYKHGTRARRIFYSIQISLEAMHRLPNSMRNHFLDEINKIEE